MTLAAIGIFHCHIYNVIETIEHVKVCSYSCMEATCMLSYTLYFHMKTYMVC